MVAWQQQPATMAMRSTRHRGHREGCWDAHAQAEPVALVLKEGVTALLERLAGDGTMAAFFCAL